MKFTKFDRANLKALRTEMQAVMDKYGVKSNLKIEVGNMSFGDAEVSIKIKAMLLCKACSLKPFCVQHSI